jgi:lambda family phage portal protein
MVKRVKSVAQIENTERIASFGKLAVKAHYDAGKRGRRLASWNPSSAGPNVALATLQTIRNRSRHAGNNEWSAASSSRTVVTDMIGTGIVARPKTKNVALKAKLIALWDKFVKECDADGVLDFYGQQALVAKTWDGAGEVFVRLRPRRLNDGLAVPLQIQLLEPEMVPQLNRDQPNGNRIREGIEFDGIGRRANYWMYNQHPGDYLSVVSMQDIKPVPADQVLHIYSPDRIGQLRGVPSGTSSMVRTKIVGDYDDAVTEKAKLQNLFTGVITRPAPLAGQENIDPLTGEIITQSDNDVPMVSLEPGAMIELAPGEDVTFSNPPATGVGYNDFMRQQYLGITAGRGVPYELATGDITNVSDRTLRVVVQQYRRNIEQKQWLFMIPQFCQKVRDAWVDAAVLSGAIALRDADEAKNVEWSPQAWQYIHPVQDVQSKVAEIDAGIVSRDQVISSRGYDPEEVDAQRAEAKKREEKLGLSIVPEPQPTASQIAADKKIATDQNAKKAKAEIDLLVAQTDAFKQSADSEQRKADAYAKLQQAHESKARADAEYAVVMARQSEAEFALATARMDRLKSDSELSAANVELQRSISAKESEARISEITSRADTAELESIERTIALRSAEAYAKEQRELILEAERTRTEAARLELEAARLGLDELRGD